MCQHASTKLNIMGNHFPPFLNPLPAAIHRKIFTTSSAKAPRFACVSHIEERASVRSAWGAGGGCGNFGGGGVSVLGVGIY